MNIQELGGGEKIMELKLLWQVSDPTTCLTITNRLAQQRPRAR